MNILMFIIAFCLITDALFLIFYPSLYRKSLVYVNEMLGPVWSSLYGFLFSICGIFVFISVVFSGLSVFYIFASLIMSVIGLFFLLSATEKFGHFAGWWSSRSNWSYRISGITFAVLAIMVCYIIMKIR